jgi:hypothetical protein
MFGLSSSIRVGIPTATDPDGRSGPGMWWLTGSARPALVPERSRPRRRIRVRRTLLRRRPR